MEKMEEQRNGGREEGRRFLGDKNAKLLYLQIGFH